jgi:hypothetical protein
MSTPAAIEFGNLLWKFEDLIFNRTISGIFKDFPGIYWEKSGTYSQTKGLHGNNVGFPWGQPN